MEGTAIMKTTKQPDAAKKLADFMASKEANQITARWWAIVAYRVSRASSPASPTTTRTCS